MDSIYQIFNNPFFVIVGSIFTITAIIAIFLNFCYWILGLGPLLKRLGYGRWFRKIAIVANPDEYSNIKKDLVDSGIFREKNISSAITDKSISDIKDHNLILVDYQSFSEDDIKSILQFKHTKAGMIFYFSPKDGEKIPNDIYDLIGNTPNTTIVNLRGRMLNDIVTTLITTSYEKR